VKELDGKPVGRIVSRAPSTGSGRKKDPAHLKLVEDWLRSYRPEEIFDESGTPHPDVLACCPKGDRRIGCNPHTFGGRLRRPLKLPEVETHAIEVVRSSRGETEISPVEAAAKYLAGVIEQNPRTFRIFSPDELMSNKLGAIFEAPTQRNYQWPIEGANRSADIGSCGGRVLAGTQWILPSKPRLHQRAAEQKEGYHACLSAPRRQLPVVDS